MLKLHVIKNRFGLKMRARERHRRRQWTTSSAISRVGGSARPRGPLCTTRPEPSARVIWPIQSTSAPFAVTLTVLIDVQSTNKSAYCSTRCRGWVAVPSTKVEPEPTPQPEPEVPMPEPEPTPQLEPEVPMPVVAPKIETERVSDSTEPSDAALKERYNIQSTKHAISRKRNE